MPVVIASIRHRRGLRSELPAALAEGELGLTLDTGELFIGTPTLPQTATRTVFPFQNTAILTEWSPNVETLLWHVHRARDVDFDPADPSRGLFPIPDGADPATQTVATPDLHWRNGSTYGVTRISRRLQEVVDEIVSVHAWGARGDGSYDGSSTVAADLRYAETQALRTAILDTAATRNDPSGLRGWRRRALHFPAGVYEVLGPLPLPPGARWIGDGPENTVIALVREADPTIGFDDCVLFTVDGGLDSATYLSTAALDPTQLDPLLANHAYANIDPANPPRDIVIEGMAFVVRDRGPSGVVHDVVRLVRAERVVFRDCVFAADYPGGKPVTGVWESAQDSVAMVVDGVGSASAPSEVRFENCEFRDATYGLLLTDAVHGIDFTSCRFRRLFRGLSVGENLTGVAQGGTLKSQTYGVDGPRRIHVQGCTFDDIEAEGISVWRASTDDRSGDSFFADTHGVISVANRFRNVGNGSWSALVDSNVVPAIQFAAGAPWCVSVADTFERNRSREASGAPVTRVAAAYHGNHLVLNPQDPPILPGGQIPLPAGTNTLTPTGIFAQLGAGEAGVRLVYRVSELTGGMPGGYVRTGVLEAVSDGGSLAWSDRYADDGGVPFVTLQPVLVGGTRVEIHFTNSDPSRNAMLRYRLEYLSF